MATTAKRAASVAFFGALVGFLSCREPTQVMLIVTTDAGCPASDDRPRLNDVFIVSGRDIVLGVEDLTPNAETSACEFQETDVFDRKISRVGSLALLPGDGDDKSVEVLIVAGVTRGDDTTDPNISMRAGQCAGYVNRKESIEGKPCIVARRKLTFVDHNRLVLPVELDTRCIGEECGEDLTCFQGNCVPPDVVCTDVDGEDCADPVTCENECEENCTSGTAECVGGECQCLGCDEEECSASCFPTFGACVEDDSTCVCQAACDPDECDELCGGSGECNGSSCECATCIDAQCEMEACPTSRTGFSSCTEIDGVDTCFCPDDDCVDETCGMMECGTGQVGECLTDPAGCACQCDDLQCDLDCDGTCQTDGTCACPPQCTPTTCENFDCSEPYQEAVCVAGGCLCECAEDACDLHCQSTQQTDGSCSTEPGSEACECEPTTSMGGGGTNMSGGGGMNMSGGGGSIVTDGGGGSTANIVVVDGGGGGVVVVDGGADPGAGGSSGTTGCGLCPDCLQPGLVQACVDDICQCVCEANACATECNGSCIGNNCMCAPNNSAGPAMMDCGVNVVPDCGMCAVACGTTPGCEEISCSFLSPGNFSCICGNP